MILWDLLEAAQYPQVFSIYSKNAYGQNIPVARGTRAEMMAIDIEDGEENLFQHLMHKIDYYMVNKSCVMVVFLRDEHFDSKAEEYYPAEYVKKWERLNPDTRPYLFSIETEAYTDKFISKFPILNK